MFPYIVIAGGNGSFISVFDELIEKQIDPLKATFCILPFPVYLNTHGHTRGSLFLPG